MKKKIRPFLFIILYFLSACSFLTLICEFRSLKIKIFLTIAAVAICAFNFTKNKALLFKKGSKNIVEMALCIETICFFDFYFNAVHTRPQSLLKIADILSLDKIFNESNIFAIIGLLLCLIGFLFVKTISPYFLKVTNKVIYILKENSFSFFAILSVCIVSFIAIIRANFYYIDDLGRAIYGYGITGDFSRYIANMLSEIFHGNSWLADISPLPQLIALVIISITAILLLHIMSKTIDKKTTKWSFLSLIPICISPYFLSCLSYKYDAPYMALSILVSILPLIFFKYNTAFYSVTVFISMLTMCMTYQVSSGIFPMLVMIMALLMWTQKTEYKKLFRFILSSALSYIAALIVFRLVIMDTISADSYVDTGISISKLIPNVKNYLNIFNNDFPSIWKILFLAIIIFFIALVIKTAQQQKIITALAAVLISVCSFILSFGVYIVFNNPLTSPRAFYGIGVFVSIISCFIFLINKSSITKLPIVCLSWLFIVYCFIFGNALNIQKEYINFRTELVINDCNDLDLLKEDEITKLQTIGTAGYQRAVENIIKEYPLIKKQVPIALSDSKSYWGAYQLKEYYGLKIVIANVNEAQPDEKYLLKDTYYHSIYKVDDIVVIELKDVES